MIFPVLLDGSFIEIAGHAHATDNAKNDAEKIKVEMCHRAVTTVEQPRQIIQHCTTGASLESCQSLPSYTSLRRTIQRKRKRDNQDFPNPRSVADIQLPDTLKVTTRGDNFILWDSGDDDPSRLFMFGTQANLTTLVEFGIIEFSVQLSCTVFCPRYCCAFLSTRICVRDFELRVFDWSPQLIRLCITLNGYASTEVVNTTFSLLSVDSMHFYA